MTFVSLYHRHRTTYLWGHLTERVHCVREDLSPSLGVEKEQEELGFLCNL